MAGYASPYQALGEEGIRNLTKAFYAEMGEARECAHIRAMHSVDLSPMVEKLGDYLIGWMGGPPLYFNKYGTVCMTEPHAGYWIGPRERDQWLLCMNRALDRIGADEELKEMLREPLRRIANAVMNRQSSPEAESHPDVIAVG